MERLGQLIIGIRLDSFLPLDSQRYRVVVDSGLGMVDCLCIDGLDIYQREMAMR
jgi:hypothetical protein